MADAAPVVQIGGKSVEEVALELVYIVAKGEEKSAHGVIKADRKWVLDIFDECLKAAKGDRIIRSQE